MENLFTWIVVFAIALLIRNVIYGFVTEHLAISKGYDKGFAWGFWLGTVGVLALGFKPNVVVNAKEDKKSVQEDSDVDSMLHRSSEHTGPKDLRKCPKCGMYNKLNWEWCYACKEPLLKKEEVDSD